MASVIQQRPAGPSEASAHAHALDRFLDPVLFKALSDPTRVRLFACLVKCARPCSVTEVAACCAIDFSMVARHLAALARVGLLDVRKEGRTVWYQAPAASLSARFRAIAEAIDEWSHDAGCDAPSSATPGSGSSCCAPASPTDSQ